MANLIRRDDLGSTDLSDVTAGKQLANVSPGEVLRIEFLEPLGLSARRLARELGVPPNRVTGILGGARTVTAETALRLGERFGTSPEFWLNLQNAFNLETARRKRGAPIGRRRGDDGPDRPPGSAAP